ncbi:MAG: VOC family protein [Candidatus Heimdallarchaeota archaeon]|nr:VOC family protein [Candidatus Heimdallarchaeota archaeon]MDH5645522.1 VOC family protein [Candidatus Heimdallarchaeota archaeon]
MKIFGELKQVIIHVKDMQLMVEFYRDILQFSISYPLTDDFTDQNWVSFNSGNCSLCLHSGLDSNKTYNSNIRLTFEVEDINIASNYLIENKIEVSEIRSPAPNKLVCDFKDIENNNISIEYFGN